jgi:hypothetical protein
LKNDVESGLGTPSAKSPALMLMWSLIKRSCRLDSSFFCTAFGGLEKKCDRIAVGWMEQRATQHHELSQPNTID